LWWCIPDTSGERLNGIQEVSGSIPLISTKGKRTDFSVCPFIYVCREPRTSCIYITAASRPCGAKRRTGQRFDPAYLHQGKKDRLFGLSFPLCLQGTADLLHLYHGRFAAVRRKAPHRSAVRSRLSPPREKGQTFQSVLFFFCAGGYDILYC
jgi:hypothetical protein